MDIAAGNQNKYNQTAENKPDIVLDQYHVVGGQVRRCQRFFKRPVKHVKIDGNDQPAGNNAFCKVKRGKNKAGQAGDPSRIQFPHRTSLSMRCCVCIRLLHSVDFFNGEHNVVKSRYNSEPQKDKHQPWRRAEDFVQKKPDKQADKYGQRNRKSESAVPAKLSYHLSGFFFHIPHLKGGSYPIAKIYLATTASF